MSIQDIMAREIVIKKVNGPSGLTLAYSKTIMDHVAFYMKDYFQLQDLLGSQTPANKERIESNYIAGTLEMK